MCSGVSVTKCRTVRLASLHNTVSVKEKEQLASTLESNNNMNKIQAVLWLRNFQRQIWHFGQRQHRYQLALCPIPRNFRVQARTNRLLWTEQRLRLLARYQIECARNRTLQSRGRYTSLSCVSTHVSLCCQPQGFERQRWW